MKTAEELVKRKESKTFYVSPDTTIYNVVQIMIKNRIGAILIKEGEKVTGIWTERDFLRNCADDGFNLREEKIGDHMITNVHFAQYDESLYSLMDHFLGLRFRHIPILKDEECIGILSSGDVMKAVMIEKDRELRELNAIVSWEYYENWKW